MRVIYLFKSYMPVNREILHKVLGNYKGEYELVYPKDSEFSSLMARYGIPEPKTPTLVSINDGTMEAVWVL